MIKFNNKNIEDWYLSDDNISKLCYNNNERYQKVWVAPIPSPQQPCYDVTNSISSYDGTMPTVYAVDENKWYKLNNLDEYEEYGIYGNGRDITYYEGKLTIDDGYEYIYSGDSWVSVGEVSGSTEPLPDVPFTINYNAKNFDQATKTFAKTQGQLADVDAIVTAGTVTYNSNGYVEVNINSKATIIGYDSYFNRSSSAPNLTIISKQRTSNPTNCHLLANRNSTYNWMYRPTSEKLAFHGNTQINGTTVTVQPVIEGVRVDSSRTLRFNNYTDNTTSTSSNFTYGSSNSGGVALFAGYVPSGSEYFEGDFYWIYMSQNTLTDEQVQQVIAHNEGIGETIYPMYYDELGVPPNNVYFVDLRQANKFKCPWVGMKSRIDGVKCQYTDNYMWEDIGGGRLPSGYSEVEYIEKQNGSLAYINTDFKPNQDTRIVAVMQTVYSTQYGRLIGAGGYNTSNGLQFDYESYYNGTLHVSWGTINNWTIYSTCNGDYDIHTYDWDKNYFYRDKGKANQFSATTTYGNFQCTDNLGIFSFIQNGNVATSTQEHWYGRLYSFQIYDNGTLVRDFVPCIRANDDMVGLYDIVNDVFYYPPNSSSHHFIAGPSTITEAVKIDYTKYDPNDTEIASFNTVISNGGVTTSSTTLTIFDVPLGYSYEVSETNDMFSADSQTFIANQTYRKVTFTLYPNNREFSTVADLEAYEYAWNGMKATVDGTKYEYIDGEWVENAYTQYEYIMSETGYKQYTYNTLFYPTTAHTIEIRLELTGQSLDWGRILGWSDCNCDSGNNSAGQFRFTTVTNGYQIIARAGANGGTEYRPNIGTGLPITVRLPLSATSGTYNSGGTDITLNYNYNSTFPNNLPYIVPLHFFTFGYSGDPRFAANCKIYYVKIFEGNTLVKHYVPSDSDGAPCFYEIVDGDFILNTYSGSSGGTCTLGPEIG